MKWAAVLRLPRSDARIGGLELLSRLTWGFARKASLHPRLYACACFAGWNHPFAGWHHPSQAGTTLRRLDHPSQAGTALRRLRLPFAACDHPFAGCDHPFAGWDPFAGGR
jgi:hypothetical protein